MPVTDVIDTFTEFISSLDEETDENLSRFLGYFEATWIGVVQRGRLRRPFFYIRMWNTFERTSLGLPRTTNSLEGWHRAFEHRMVVTHPSVRRLVTKIRKEKSDWELQIEIFNAGVALRSSKKKYQILNTRLGSIIKKYESYEKVDFLRAITHNL